MRFNLGPSTTGASPPPTSPPPPAVSSPSPCGRWRRPSPSLTHLYIQHIHIHFRFIPRFLTTILFAPSSHPSYVAPTWQIILQGRTITIPHSLRLMK
ncbi:hypothetical protein Hanom_Chr09g00817281 [Helianthus anomalus]